MTTEETIAREIDIYVKEYAKKHNVTEAEAREHALVKVYEHYKKGDK